MKQRFRSPLPGADIGDERLRSLVQDRAVYEEPVKPPLVGRKSAAK